MKKFFFFCFFLNHPQIWAMLPVTKTLDPISDSILVWQKADCGVGGWQYKTPFTTFDFKSQGKRWDFQKMWGHQENKSDSGVIYWYLKMPFLCLNTLVQKMVDFFSICKSKQTFTSQTVLNGDNVWKVRVGKWGVVREEFTWLLYGLFARWMREINPHYLGNVPGMPG